jgi:hypothetical protein
MNQLIADIYEMTVKMGSMLEQGKIEEFLVLLDERGTMMGKVETLKLENPNYTYPVETKQKLEATFKLDQLLIPQMEEMKTEASKALNQIKKNKQVSKSYMPYRQQTYGAFIDTNK